MPSSPTGSPRPGSARRPTSSGGPSGLLIGFIVAIFGGGLYYGSSQGWFSPPPPPRPAIVATHAPATPVPVPSPVVVEVPAAPPQPVPPTSEQLIQARIEAARSLSDLRATMARGDFAAGARALEDWLQANPGHLQAEIIQRHAERLRAAERVLPTFITKAASLTGATVISGGANWIVSGAHGTKLKLQGKTQFGTVEREVEIASLPEAALVPLLKRADAAGQTTLATTYLLGYGKAADARAAVPAQARNRDALLKAVDESEALGRDYAVITALDGVEALIKRGAFANAGTRLEQIERAVGGHDFLKVAFAEKIARWRRQIAEAPAPAATPNIVATLPKAAPQLPAVLPAAPAGVVDAARKALMDGVSTSPNIGTQGPVAIYGAASFPLLTRLGDKTLSATAAAGMGTRGRAVLFGQEKYLRSASQTDGDLGKLLLNAVQWCGQKTTPRIGFMGCDIGTFLNENGQRAASFSGPLKGSILNDYDVVILNTSGLNDEAEASALKDYLDKGGGVIAAMSAWAFPQYSQGRLFHLTNKSNLALTGVGLAFTDEFLFGSASETLAPQESAAMLNAYSALQAIQQSFAPAPVSALSASSSQATPPHPMSSDDVQQAARTLQIAFGGMPAASRPAFQKHLTAALTTGKPIIPTKEQPLQQGIDDEECARATAQAKLFQFLPAEAVIAHPAAAEFPGRVPKGAQPVTKDISMNPKIPGWHSLGLYADAGAQLSVKIPKEAIEKGYEIRLGCHSDSIYRREKWTRFPEITKTTTLTTVESTVASSFGGLVYIVVPERVKEEKPIVVSIAGAVEAPLFVLGETTDAQWQEIKKRPGPWAEFACRNIILTAPTDVARDVQNPTEVMQYWQKVMDMQDDLSGVAAERKRPERIVADVIISNGFMHSGYPIMIHQPEAREMLTVTRSKMPGWGFHHEVGHNHQKNEWTFEGAGEVTNNIFSIYLTQELNGYKRPQQHPGVTAEAQEKRWGRYKTMGAPFTEWKSDPFLALGTYIKLIDSFGWDPMKQYFRSYQDPSKGPKPKTDDEKRDQFMVRYAKVIGKNLGPYFDAWGIPVSASAKAEISNLPVWMPKEMK